MGAIFLHAALSQWNVLIQICMYTYTSSLDSEVAILELRLNTLSPTVPNTLASVLGAFIRPREVEFYVRMQFPQVRPKVKRQ